MQSIRRITNRKFVVFLTLFASAVAATVFRIYVNENASTCCAEINIRHVQRVIGNGGLAIKQDDIVIATFKNRWDGKYRKVRSIGTLLFEQLSLSYAGDEEDLVTPLILDLARNGFRLGPAGLAVEFDINADGEPPKMQWVAEGTDDGFLFLDQNANGAVDSGAELFGSGTTMLGSGQKAAHGYAALSQYDGTDLGGNGDGQITSSDEIWSELKLWIDKNADAESQPEFGITTLELNFKNSRKTDAAGNLVPYWSWVTLKDVRGPKKLKMADVFFQTLD